MTAKSTDADFVSLPNHDKVYHSIESALSATIYYFSKRHDVCFVILMNASGKYFKVTPNHTYLKTSMKGGVGTYSIIFKGTYSILRSLAQAFPLDLFGAANVSQCT